MKQWNIAIAAIILMINGNILPTASAADPTLGRVPEDRASPATPAGPIDGKLLKIDGPHYIIQHSSSGEKLQVHVDQTTIMHGSPKVGDSVIVDITPDGHAVEMKLGK